MLGKISNFRREVSKTGNQQSRVLRNAQPRIPISNLEVISNIPWQKIWRNFKFGWNIFGMEISPICKFFVNSKIKKSIIAFIFQIFEILKIGEGLALCRRVPELYRDKPSPPFFLERGRFWNLPLKLSPIQGHSASAKKLHPMTSFCNDQKKGWKIF